MYKNPFKMLALLFIIVSAFGFIAHIEALSWIGVIGLIICVCLLISRDSNNHYKLMNNLEKEIKRQVSLMNKDFTVSQQFFSSDKETYIALDEINKKICIVYNQSENTFPLKKGNVYDYKSELFAFSDILQSSILHDEFSVTTVSRVKLDTRYFTESLEFRRLINAITSPTTTVEHVKKVQLQVVVNNMSKAYHRITFEIFPKGVAKTEVAYTAVEKEVSHWHSLLSYLIKQADEQQKPSNASPNSSVADELIKLSSLLRNNIITEEEFNNQKKKLLG